MYSQNDKSNFRNSAKQNRADDDTWIDRCLDHLRDHRLPPVVEVMAAWQVAFSCIVYYGYSYFRAWSMTKIRSATLVPLTTEPRRRRRGHPDDENDESSSLLNFWWDDTFQELCRLSTEQLIAKVRSDVSLRRMVSRFMRQTAATTSTTTTSTTTHRSSSAAPDEAMITNLRSRLEAVWPQLLEFPPLLPLPDDDAATEPFDISLIIPSYREPTERIAWTLEQAWRHCGNDPKRIQVIIVHVVEQKDDDDHQHHHVDTDDDTLALVSRSLELNAGSTMSLWGDVTIVQCKGGGGRGPAQNYGATFARGRLLSFLHADTLIPMHWDQKVIETLLLGKSRKQERIVQACAFSFGHNTQQLEGRPYPWGIRAVWLLGNLRAYLFRLPYGDHIISMPSTYFRYIGGFPDQCIMEDYELMDILRKRATVLPMESIRIIGGPFTTAKCSVRRWQRFGTVYVTLVNALLVHRYSQGGWTADDIYEYYYERPTKDKGNMKV